MTICSAASCPMAFCGLGCDTCKKELLMPFSCKRRRFCSSCAARRMAQTAAHLARASSLRATRQWVVSVPIPLGYWTAPSKRPDRKGPYDHPAPPSCSMTSTKRSKVVLRGRLSPHRHAWPRGDVWAVRGVAGRPRLRKPVCNYLLPRLLTSPCPRPSPRARLRPYPASSCGACRAPAKAMQRLAPGRSGEAAAAHGVHRKRRGPGVAAGRGAGERAASASAKCRLFFLSAHLVCSA